MKNKDKILFWIPRGLSILYIVFLEIFAFDVFEPGKSFSHYIVPFLMQLIPSLIFLALLIIAWKHNKVGGILFLILGIAFTLFFNTYTELIAFLLISLPVFLIGIFFLSNGFRK